MASDEDNEEMLRLQKENCIFCKIVKGEIPSKKVYEDDTMLAILDINPAVKGHTLVMPKEHYPILPVIPPEVFKHIFRTTKYLAKGVRDGSVTTGMTLFIANGAVAGQQSPHFLFHIIPRDRGDSLTNFSLPEDRGEGYEKLTSALQSNIASVIKAYLQREGKYKGEAPSIPKEIPSGTPQEILSGEAAPSGRQPDEKQPSQPKTSQSEVPPLQASPEQTANLADVIMANPALKEMIINEPEKIKELMKTNNELARLFQGVNIDRLSQKLGEFKDKKGGQEENQEPAKDAPDLDKIGRLFR